MKSTIQNGIIIVMLALSVLLCGAIRKNTHYIMSSEPKCMSNTDAVSEIEYSNILPGQSIPAQISNIVMSTPHDTMIIVLANIQYRAIMNIIMVLEEDAITKDKVRVIIKENEYLQSSVQAEKLINEVTAMEVHFEKMPDIDLPSSYAVIAISIDNTIVSINNRITLCNVRKYIERQYVDNYVKPRRE